MEKLSKIQAELKAPKWQYNSFGKYKYRSCEDIVEAVKPLCVLHKCILILSDEMIMLGNRFYIKATATLKDMEKDQEITVTGYAREEETKKGMDGSQITWASSSYARKYALNWLFLIDDTKDSDNSNKADKWKDVFDKTRMEKLREFSKWKTKETVMQHILKVKKDCEIIDDVKEELDLFISQLV